MHPTPPGSSIQLIPVEIPLDEQLHAALAGGPGGVAGDTLPPIPAHPLLIAKVLAQLLADILAGRLERVLFGVAAKNLCPALWVETAVLFGLSVELRPVQLPRRVVVGMPLRNERVVRHRGLLQRRLPVVLDVKGLRSVGQVLLPRLLLVRDASHGFALRADPLGVEFTADIGVLDILH